MNARGGPTGPTGSVLQGPFRSFAARLGGEGAGPAAIVTPAGEAGCRPELAAQVDILEVKTCFFLRRYLCPNFSRPNFSMSSSPTNEGRCIFGELQKASLPGKYIYLSFRVHSYLVGGHLR